MSLEQSRPYTFDRVVRILAGAALLAGVIWLINVLRNVLLPFFVACLIAYILDPLVCYNRRILRTKGRALAVFITLGEVTLVLGMLCYFCIPSIIKEVEQLGVILTHSVSGGSKVPFIPENIIDEFRKWLSNINVKGLIENSHFESLVDSGTSVISSALEMLMHFLEWLLTFIYVIFILIDFKPLMRGFKTLVPHKYRHVAYMVGDDIKVNMNRYFRSQAVIASCAAVFYCIGFSIVGIPMAIVLGITVGVLYMIPYFQYVTLIPVTLVCLIDSMSGSTHFWSQLGQCGLVYVVSQCICDYILTPKIMGKSMGLNPAIILLALSVWGTLLGIIGMIIALPLTTILLAYYQEYIIGNDNPDDKNCEPGTPAPTPPHEP